MIRDYLNILHPTSGIRYSILSRRGVSLLRHYVRIALQSRTSQQGGDEKRDQPSVKVFSWNIHYKVCTATEETNYRYHVLRRQMEDIVKSNQENNTVIDFWLFQECGEFSKKEDSELFQIINSCPTNEYSIINFSPKQNSLTIIYNSSKYVCLASFGGGLLDINKKDVNGRLHRSQGRGFVVGLFRPHHSDVVFAVVSIHNCHCENIGMVVNLQLIAQEIAVQLSNMRLSVANINRYIIGGDFNSNAPLQVMQRELQDNLLTGAVEKARLHGVLELHEPIPQAFIMSTGVPDTPISFMGKELYDLEKSKKGSTCCGGKYADTVPKETSPTEFNKLLDHVLDTLPLIDRFDYFERLKTTGEIGSSDHSPILYTLKPIV